MDSVSKGVRGRATWDGAGRQADRRAHCVRIACSLGREQDGYGVKLAACTSLDERAQGRERDMSLLFRLAIALSVYEIFAESSSQQCSCHAVGSYCSSSFFFCLVISLLAVSAIKKRGRALLQAGPAESSFTRSLMVGDDGGK